MYCSVCGQAADETMTAQARCGHIAHMRCHDAGACRTCTLNLSMNMCVLMLFVLVCGGLLGYYVGHDLVACPGERDALLRRVESGVKDLKQATFPGDPQTIESLKRVVAFIQAEIDAMRRPVALR